MRLTLTCFGAGSSEINEGADSQLGGHSWSDGLFCWFWLPLRS